ncbi:MAG: hypothetical protein IKY01_06730 [Prevotella sp.]|nr:hypothetical protein [Prevotella sp.]
MATLLCSCGSNGQSSESRARSAMPLATEGTQEARLDGRVVTDEGEANTTKSEITAETCCHRWKHRRIVRHASLSPQDDA